MIPIPRIVIAGTHSGCGKTTIATGLMAALVSRGLRVQPFKVGPDFIDPTHHTKICGRISRNLDPFMMGEEEILDTFQRACTGSDIAVIEGVMGLYDGIDGTGNAGTAHVATLLSSPVVLVVDAKGMSRSVHAVIRGFMAFDPDVRIDGVIINRIGSPRHRQLIGSPSTIPVVGWIPRRDAWSVPSRHLGLAMAHETAVFAQFGTIMSEYCDLDELIRIARKAPPLAIRTPHESDPYPEAKIGIAWDSAFCFYYQDNLDRLRSAGAGLVFFSPLAERLPDVDGIYIGGGYPELHLDQLEKSACRTDIVRAADAGTPVYGECGGMMYLTEEISGTRTHRLCGVFPARTEMTSTVQALGYVQGEAATGQTCFPAGLAIRGHEFHYSRVIPEPDARYAFTLLRGKGIDNGRDGILQDCSVGTYTHAYFSDDFCRCFVDLCLKRRHLS